MDKEADSDLHRHFINRRHQGWPRPADYSPRARAIETRVIEMKENFTTENAQHIDYDGAIIDIETGEVLGYKDAADSKGDVEDIIKWATERRANADAKRAGLIAEQNLLLAGIKERFESMIAEQTRKIEWIDKQYKETMEKYATEKVIGGKPKSVKLPFATLGFRSSKGAVEVTDAPTAACTLIRAGHGDAVEFTINYAELLSNSDNGAFGANLLLKAIQECFYVELNEKLELVQVHIPSSMRPSIKASLVPSTIGEEIKGVRRNSPANPLGDFYVKH